MTTTAALAKLNKAGFKVSENKGSFHAEKTGTFISFFVNTGSDKTSKFTYEGSTSCAPTYGMSLKAALEA
jgi:hypothetical protein